MASNENVSLFDQLAKAKKLMDDDNRNLESESSQQNPMMQALEILENLQDVIQRISLFSTNEDLSDIQTSSIPLMSIEYYMAKALLQLRTSSSSYRNSNVLRAVELFRIFLHRCEEYEGLLHDETLDSYKRIEAILDSNEDDIPELPPQSRDEKISNFKKTRLIQSQVAQMEAKLAQRQRLGIAEGEDIDGYDRDGLERSMYLNQINEAAIDSISELYSGTLELQMLKMAVKIEADNIRKSEYTHQEDSVDRGNVRGKNYQNSNQRMQMTQVLQHPVTGELIFKRQDLQSSVFKPSWNQPTMTLEELAEKEVKDAIEREARQKLSEAEQKNAPRRYEYLARDGLEDNVALVDASAKLDREWDEWKEQNPRGSGNKMADRGDRNF